MLRKPGAGGEAGNSPTTPELMEINSKDSVRVGNEIVKTGNRIRRIANFKDKIEARLLIDEWEKAKKESIKTPILIVEKKVKVKLEKWYSRLAQLRSAKGRLEAIANNLEIMRGDLTRKAWQESKGL